LPPERCSSSIEGKPCNPRAFYGSWVGLDREYAGLRLSAAQSQEFFDIPVFITVGIDADYSKERRQGGETLRGDRVSAELARDEDNVAESVNVFLVGNFLLSERYSLVAGARVGEVEFSSKDFYLADGLGSGGVRYSQFSPVIGVTRHVSPSMNVFANYGQGFETPTLAELAYSRVGGDNANSFKSDLKAAKNKQAEAGLKWRPDGTQSVSGTLFWLETQDEIVTDLNVSGRASFKNASGTKRTGGELSWARAWSQQWRSLLAATVIDATYDSGKKIPGIPAHLVFAEVEWAQLRNARALAHGWSAGIELQSIGRRYANDANTLSADPFESVAIRSAYSRTLGSTDLQVFARIDNLLDDKYVGSVIVGNASPFEPSPERNWMLGLKAVTRF
jgi:iron complex outermembrane receptor protein